MKHNIILLLLVISIFTLTCSRKSKSDNNMEQDFSTKLNNEFVQIIESFIDSVEINWTLKPLLETENFYYTIKFFEIQDSVFFTLRISYIFPEYEYFNNTYYKNDTSCMYYFKIHNRNIIVIDYPKSKGHGIFEKNIESNRLAIKEMKRNDSIFEMKKDSIRPSNPDIFRETFKVQKTIKGVNLVKLDSIVFVPPYSNESKNYIQIIEEDL